MRNLSRIVLSLTIALGVMSGCGKKPDEEKKGPPGTPVTVTKVVTTTAYQTEQIVGRIESGTSPQVNAEVPGTVTRVLVDVGDAVKKGQVLAELNTTDLALVVSGARADVARLEALSSSQRRQAERMAQLYKDKLVSEGNYEDSQAQMKSLIEQLAAARAKLRTAQRSFGKARIVAPVDGIIESRHAAPGDYVDGRAPLFTISSSSSLRIHLPFPESLAPRMHTGLKVRLTSPVAPDKEVTAAVDSIGPTVGNSQSIEAIVHVANPGGWSEGASVNAELILDEHPNALMVPEISIVRRPAGDVVYVINGNTAEQRIVTTGVHQKGLVEIVSGLTGNETVVVDGAGFLTDKAPILVKSARS